MICSEKNTLEFLYMMEGADELWWEHFGVHLFMLHA